MTDITAQDLTKNPPFKIKIDDLEKGKVEKVIHSIAEHLHLLDT